MSQDQLQSLAPSQARFPDQAHTVLGDAGIAEVCANLWPRDCQSCGDRLGTVSSVRIMHMSPDQFSASLHHPQCQNPVWEDRTADYRAPEHGPVVYAPHASYSLQTFHTTVWKAGKRSSLPVVIVNPAMEAVRVERTNGSWRVATVSDFVEQGLRPPPTVWTPVQHSGCEVADPGAVQYPSLTLTLPGGQWRHPIEHYTKTGIHQNAGLLLFVTTTLLPTQTPPTDLQHVFDSSHVVHGWIPLRGANPLVRPHS